MPETQEETQQRDHPRNPDRTRLGDGRPPNRKEGRSRPTRFERGGKTTERETPFTEMTGTSALLILGGSLRTELTDTNLSEINAIAKGEAPLFYIQINNASAHERDIYWQADTRKAKEDETETQTSQRQKATWNEDVNALLASYQNTPEETFLKDMGITIEGGADSLYQKYMADNKGDVVVFVSDLLKHHSPQAIRENMDVILNIGGMYGENSAKIASLLTEGLMQVRENPETFKTKAQQQIQQGENMPGYELLAWLNRVAPPIEEKPTPQPTDTEQPEPPKEEEAPTPTEQLTPELARTNPDLFKLFAIQQLEQKSQYGGDMWNLGVETGVVDPNKFTLRTDNWVSHSRANGEITLGTEPMDQATKEKLFFLDTNFSYEDEVMYRLNHELAHDLYYLTQNDGKTSALVELTNGTRAAYQNGERGLTALGSLSHYKGVEKPIEDTTELLAMYMWNPDYLKKYLQFLSTVDEPTAARMGLANPQESELIFDAVKDIVEGTLGEKLTPEFAETNPEAFKAYIIDRLQRTFVSGAALWDYAIQNGLTSEADITIDPSTGSSESFGDTKITLGTQPFNEETKALFYQGMANEYPRQILYSLGHEILHKVGSNVFNRPDYNNVFQAIVTFREQNRNQGFSLLGNSLHHQELGHSPQEQAKEDLVELLNMYVVYPDYLKSFLDFLADPTKQGEREHLGLTTINTTIAEKMFAQIDTAMRTTLGIKDEERQAA